jgi:RNA polymerase sigma-70 factor (ECF subfamily)
VTEQPWGSESALLARLRSGDEAAFAVLVDDLHRGLLGFAATFTTSPALAEDIVQETWMGVIRGLHGFEARSSLKTWIYSILARRARTLAAREARQGDPAPHPVNGGVEWEPGPGRRGLWEGSPVPWALEDPAAIHQSLEAMEVLQAALDGLPLAQRQVVLLRDVEGLSAVDICNVLDLSETNQRVLLHRGRARLRGALDRYVRDGARPPTPAARGAGGGVR